MTESPSPAVSGSVTSTERPPRRRHLRLILGLIAALLFAAGGSAITVAVSSQNHAPQPGPQTAGTTGPNPAPVAPALNRAPVSPTLPSPATSRTASTAAGLGPVLPRSLPVSITIPAIGVRSSVQPLGLNPDGTLQVPQPGPLYNQAAWYQYSPTPGQLGPSIIEAHVDSAAEGPSVFFRLGALKPGDQVNVTLADHTVAVFTVSGVRQYPKAVFPTATIYGNTPNAALRLLTCGGTFDSAAHSYLDNTTVFASLSSSHPG